MTFKRLEKSEIELLTEFFSCCNTSEDHRYDSFEKIIYYLQTDDFYNAYINIEDDVILSVVFMRDLTEQKSRVLDLILTRKNVSIYQNKVGKLVDYAVKEGEQRGYFRFYTVLTEDMKDTVDELMKKDLVFPWRKRYDTYVDEIIEPYHMSLNYLHWGYLMNTTLRAQRKLIRHHHLKPEYYSTTSVSGSI
jgi:hypothetical protein